MTRGFSLVELLVVFALLGLLASLGVARTTSQHDQVQLESGLRRLRVGLDRGRRAALRQREPCVLALTPEGWVAPHEGTLPGCRAAATPLNELADAPLVLDTNLPANVRFSANGLVLDGGMVLLRHPRISRTACLVIGLPLGITRVGTYDRDTSEVLASSHCRPGDAG